MAPSDTLRSVEVEAAATELTLATLAVTLLASAVVLILGGVTTLAEEGVAQLLNGQPLSACRNGFVASALHM